MEVLSIVVRDGCVIDLSAYLKALTDRGVRHSALNYLRLRLAQVSGSRRAVIEIANRDVSVSLRPLAARPSEITIDSAGVPDIRRNPERRGGPDLAWAQSTLMRTDADEALLIDDSGRVISGLLAPLVMIKDGAAYVSSHPRVTPSIALEGVLDILRQQGVDVRHLDNGFGKGELMRNETWLVDALYGASLVSGWLEYGGVVPARTGIDRMGVPTHREVNELRLERLEHA